MPEPASPSLAPAISPVRVKDLGDEQFERLYSCDRFTATVLGSRLRYIVQHMATGLLRNAFSMILREWGDFAATLSGPASQDYPMPAVSNGVTMFMGTMTDAIRNTVEEFGPENLRPGDILIANDPYRVGTHVNDVCYVKPVFVGEEPVAFVNLQAHMIDMGGVVPAGFSGTKRNVYESGLVLGPQLLFRDDEPVKSTWSLIFDNARFGGIMLPDIKSIAQNLRFGDRMVRETIERYGLDAYLGGVRYACDVSADELALALEALPDGDHVGKDLIDCDGIDDSREYRVTARVCKQQDRIEIDLSGSSPQARTSINAGWLDTKTAVGVAIKSLLAPQGHFTSGSFRNVDILMPSSSFVNASPPDGAIFLYWEAAQAVACAIYQALAPVLGEQAIGGEYSSLSLHNASGIRPDGSLWVSAAQCGGEHGAWGATAEGDADSFNLTYTGNNLAPSVESIEADVPVVIVRKEYAADTAGAGVHRGGASVLKDTLFLSDSEHQVMPLHTKRPSGFGVLGGGAGRTGGVWLYEPEAVVRGGQPTLLETGPRGFVAGMPIAGRIDPATNMPGPDGEYHYFARQQAWLTRPLSVFRYLTNAGGGWGDPLERDPELVARDVRNGYVSVAAAAATYAVVVVGDPDADPEGVAVDLEATARLRSGRGSGEGSETGFGQRIGLEETS